MIIPSLVIFLPDITTNWIKIIPTYYLVDTVYRVLNFEAGWGDVWQNLAVTLLFAMLFVGLGVAALRRKFT
jgi:ABC-2 type transport system permease protein